MPQKPITFRNNPSRTVERKTLIKLIEALLLEIKHKKRRFTHFTILKHSNFNRRKQCGLLVLKFKDYPFVLKLFIEQPKTFVNPHCKGSENVFFFYMAGGSNRHIMGFTRIKNRELVTNELEKHPRWDHRVHMPRKWFWLPEDTKWLEITGSNMKNTNLKTLIPGTYAIIADAIDLDREVHIPGKEKRSLIMHLCNDLHLFVDPHMDNFIITYDHSKQEFTIVIIDTEHFPSVVGIKEEKHFSNHTEWFLYLAGKCFSDIYLRSKKDRITAQKTPHHQVLD